MCFRFTNHFGKTLTREGPTRKTRTLLCVYFTTNSVVNTIVSKTRLLSISGANPTKLANGGRLSIDLHHTVELRRRVIEPSFQHRESRARKDLGVEDQCKRRPSCVVAECGRHLQSVAPAFCALWSVCNSTSPFCVVLVEDRTMCSISHVCTISLDMSFRGQQKETCKDPRFTQTSSRR